MALKRDTRIRLADHARRWGSPLIKALAATLRLKVVGWTRIRRYLREGKPLVFAFWHGDMLLGWYTVGYLRPAAIVSQAGDGDIASAVLEGLDFVTFRGSSTRGGREAYLAMMRHLRNQDYKVSAYASDGPRGPRRVMKGGTLMTAMQLGGYIVPCGYSAKHSLRARGWDKFFMPLPFTRALVHYGKPILAEQGLRGEAFERRLKEVSDRCREHQEAADRYFDDEA